MKQVGPSAKAGIQKEGLDSGARPVLDAGLSPE